MKKVVKKTIVFVFILTCLFINCMDFNHSLLTPYNKDLEKRDFLHSSNSDVEIKTPENRTYSTQSGHYLNSYDFNDLHPFEDVFGRIEEIDGHKNVFKIRHGYSYSIKNQFSETYGTIEFYFNTEDASDKTIMSLKGLETTPHIYFYVFDDEWFFYDNDTFNEITLTDNYKPMDNTWHHVKIDFESTAGGYSGLAQEKCRITVDGHSSSQLNMFRSPISPPPFQIDEIWLVSYVDQPDGSSYFDAFGYSWSSPYYNIGDNLKQGLPLIFETIIEIDEMWYSIDSQANIEILGNTTIPMPSFGSHNIQVTIDDPIATIYQSSKIYFVIGPIEITSPHQNSIWEEGGTYDITWISRMNISKVDIEIFKGGILKFSEYNVNNTGSHEWIIPEGVSRGKDWNIKITDSSNSTLFGISEYFEVLTSIYITSPSLDSIWYSGKPQVIDWLTTGNISNIDIEVYKSSTLMYSLVNDTENTGKYTWLIPYSIEAGTDWNIKVIDSHNNSIFDYSDNFEIYTNKSITITNPNSGTHWERGTNQYITWSYTGEITNVDIEIYKDTTLKYNISGTECDGARFWEISPNEEVGGDWWIRIKNSDNTSIYDDSNEFEIYYHPDILVRNPRFNSRWEADKSYFITWSVAVRTNISNVDIEVYNGLQLMYNLGQTENDGQFLWEIPYDPPPDTDWTIKIINSDNLSMYGWSTNFEIFTDKSITVISPISSSSWGFSDTHEIEWTSTGSISYVNIEIYKGEELKQIINHTENDGFYTWKLPYFNDPGDNWRINISASDYLAINDISAYFNAYIIPRVTVLEPNTPKTLIKGDYFDITWTTNGSISFVKIELFKENERILTIKERALNDGRHLWHIIEQNLKKSDDYQIKISDADDTSVFDISDDYFEITDSSLGWMNIVIIVGILGVSIPTTYFGFKIIKKRREK